MLVEVVKLNKQEVTVERSEENENAIARSSNGYICSV